MNHATPVFAALAFVATGLLSPAASAHDEVFVGVAPVAGVIAVGPVVLTLGAPAPAYYAPPPPVMYAPPPPVTTVVYRRPSYREPVYHRPVVVYDTVSCNHSSHHAGWRGPKHDHGHGHGRGYAWGNDRRDHDDHGRNNGRRNDHNRMAKAPKHRR